MASHVDVVVLGAGPGGYVAAVRAAQLGRSVAVVEEKYWGGVCLNVGCIPSKALLHVARTIAEAEEAKGQGIAFGEPRIDLDGLRGWKESVVGRLTGGLVGLAKQRKVEVVRGLAEFTSPNILRVEGLEGVTTVSFDRCIIAAGSSAIRLPGVPDDPRIIDSTGALELEDVPDRLLIVGGGII
ncbi:FAD-dependent oxidoreductase, partial [Pseudonocardia sp.]|uniref:FAD-dependent oxidoreductase n=1 Tax=Pseudonocardia sp. TaxID=60912 RepID=UPI0031FDAD3D